MSGGLAPSKSTIYLANLPFSLTNNDLHKVLEKYGKVVKVTIVKDQKTRLSKGLAFVLFLERESALKAINEINGKEMFGRRIKCSIAKDNGRTTEFIRKKYYTDKSRCFECGEEGHLSYRCPKNALGDREPPKKKEKKRKKKQNQTPDEQSESDTEIGEDPSLDTLSAAIRYQQEKQDEEEYKRRVATGDYGENLNRQFKRKKVKKGDYFSDDEEVVSE